MTRGDPVFVLLESDDPLERVEAHLTLADRALARGDDAAVRAHCRSAATLAPSDPRPGEILAGLDGGRRRSRLLSAARWAFRRES